MHIVAAQCECKCDAPAQRSDRCNLCWCAFVSECWHSLVAVLQSYRYGWEAWQLTRFGEGLGSCKSVNFTITDSAVGFVAVFHRNSKKKYPEWATWPREFCIRKGLAIKAQNAFPLQNIKMYGLAWWKILHCSKKYCIPRRPPTHEILRVILWISDNRFYDDV